MDEDEADYGEVADFAARLLWIVAQDYADEGTSARVPLLALAEVLDAAAAVVKCPSPEALSSLAAKLAALNALRNGAPPPASAGAREESGSASDS